MAGDWIKMRVDLDLDPAVIGIAAKTGLDEFQVVGRLHKFWSWADQQTINGNARSVTRAWLDRYVSAAGFAAAMIDEDWLAESDTGLSIPNYDRHNGETGKQRALAAKRAAKHRENSSRKSNADAVTKSAPRVDKREDIKPSTKVEGGAALAATSRDVPTARNRPEEIPVPAPLNTPEFIAARDAWFTQRRRCRQPLRPDYVEKQFARLLPLGPQRAAACLKHSTDNEYQGLFPEKFGEENPHANQRKRKDNTRSPVVADM